MSTSDLESRQVIEKLSLYAKGQLKAKELVPFQQFCKLFFGHMPVTDLVSRPVADLYGSAHSQWVLMKQRESGELKVKVFNPNFEQDGWESTHTIIQIIMDDMPFIVDTMRMEIHRLGLTTHLTVNSGGIKIVRDAQHNIAHVASFYDDVSQPCLLEAPVQMEIDRHTDPKTLQEIKDNLLRVLSDVKLAVADWKPMCAQMQACIDSLNANACSNNIDHLNEACEFLRWVLKNHFTFLGYRHYEIVGQGADSALRLVPKSRLGVLRDGSHSKTLRHYSELPEKARELALSKENLIIISKTNTFSTVHRSAYTDYIVVKRFDDKGQLIGESHFVGLYTSEAYSMDPRMIPLIRYKVDSVIKASKLPVNSHAGKDLLHIISTLPRDDLFHASAAELSSICAGILEMQERRTTRLFLRKDTYGRFISCLLYLPRENLQSEHISQIVRLFNKVFDSPDITHDTFVSESVLARVRFVIKVNLHKEIDYDLQQLELAIKEITKSWEDDLRSAVLDYFGEERGIKIASKYCNAFPAGYREVFESRFALSDIEHIESLISEEKLSMSIYRPLGAPKDFVRFKLYRMEQTVPLSDAVPMLENLGLRVVGEQPYCLTFADGSQVWINDFFMHYAEKPTFEIDEVKGIFQEAFQRIWCGDADDDAFNQLVLEAQMSWREIGVLRAYAGYFRQMGLSFSEQYTATTLVNNHRIAKLLIEYFKFRFDPAIKPRTAENSALLVEEIQQSLDQVATLDEDRMLRSYLTLINATLRTNYFQLADDGSHKPYLAFKLTPKMIPGLPLPLPCCEVYIHSPRFEGIHLRAAKVARGGIRWSDRLEDYRTEILGLMKAQQVKNALIVPAGAKGGFVTKYLSQGDSRETVLQEGIACYENFIRGLLDVTDDIVKGTVVHRSNTVCYDDEDPYLVVAADKGTATFSDIANRISEERGYWLGDAFASGGSTGYDHKKMGITARGTWVSAERHFQNLGFNVNETEITVVGIGDMSGDVFGNGLLMTPHLKLFAAFNHQHIFIDPNPDPVKSFAERKRLFELPRSSWEDYNKQLISEGGGVYSRFSKAIFLSPQVRQLLDLDEEHLVPNDLIKVLLQAPVDLLWNGGIGTYIKASSETNVDVGDRSNDAVRVNGMDVNARVICEGGNLGLTQLGRVEYELRGGRLNTDFIDNSAGVDCSDHEVNIKILLNAVVANGDMTFTQRNKLLSDMSDEVADLVLQNNYEQNRIISVNSFYSDANLGLTFRSIQEQEKNGKLNRALEFLPTDKEILERRSVNKGLTRSEIAILLAYAKNILKGDIVKTSLVKDPYLSQIVQAAFPTPLRKRFNAEMESHYLADEIIATQISNQVFSDMGMNFIHQMQDETGVTVEVVVRAYVAAREIFQLESYKKAIRSLDYQVDPELQYQMMYDGMRLVRRATRWFLRNRRGAINICNTVNEFKTHVDSLYERLPKLMLGGNVERFEKRVAELVDNQVPGEIAVRAASLSRIYHALNIINAALSENVNVFRVAKIYFMLVDRLDLLWFRDQINAYPITSHWSVLAKSAFKDDLDLVQRKLTADALKGSSRSIPGKINDWFQRHEDAITRWKSIMSDLRSTENIEFSILFVAIRELLNLSRSTVINNSK